LGMESSFIKLSTRINREMPSYIVSRLQEEMDGSTLAGKRILVLGVTFKEDVADIRESSVLEVIRLLMAAGAVVDYHDPLIPKVEIGGTQLLSVELTAERLASSDGVLIAVRHRGLPLEEVVKHARFVFDTRNAVAGMQGKARIVRLGGGKTGSAQNGISR